MQGRLPTKLAIAQVILHTMALACGIATVIIAIYASVRYDYAKEMTGTFVAAFWAIIMDSWEITGLSDKSRRVRRLPPGWLGLVEFLTAVLCVTAPILVDMSYTGFTFECGGRPQRVCDDVQAWRGRARGLANTAFALQWTVGGLHFLFMIFTCISGCRGSK